eukprot:scaffold5889_cov62-Phaeocystis_antarctica.AAC.6
MRRRREELHILRDGGAGPRAVLTVGHGRARPSRHRDDRAEAAEGGGRVRDGRVAIGSEQYGAARLAQAQLIEAGRRPCQLEPVVVHSLVAQVHPGGGLGRAAREERGGGGGGGGGRAGRAAPHRALWPRRGAALARIVPLQPHARRHRVSRRKGGAEGGTVGDALTVAEELRGAAPRRLTEGGVWHGER